VKVSEVLKLFGQDNKDVLTRDFDLRGLSLDSRNVAQDYAFIAIKGSAADGHRYIQTAVEKGARLVLYEDENALGPIKRNDNCVFLKVKNTRKALGKLACAYFGNPADKLFNIGITGTNGKTTVSYLADHILKTNNIKAGLIGTIQYRIADHIVPAVNTTPDALKIQHLLHHMVDHDLSHCIMEVSSHALDQYRIEGISFKTAVFTNLSHDHLDYHNDQEQYFKAKSLLFESLEPSSWAVINSDDKYAARIQKTTKAEIITYAIDDKNALLVAQDIRLSTAQTEFSCLYKNRSYQVSTGLIGKHNIYNTLAAIGVALSCGIDMEKAIASIKTMPPVAGRLEKIKSNKGFDAFIDYAHTEDALKNVLNTLQDLNPKRIITVFGCGGNRDKQKRPLMGQTASRLSDFLVLTNDNPRGEDPRLIIEQIVKGFSRDFKDYEIIPDRKSAIEKACSMAKQGDIVLIAGKGHETTQVFKDNAVEFDDRKIAKQFLEK
jgi:UDP-N-acetylmuramoyl-L-alanyl-D-glutamate--2,6-diaminopimelate ligase